MAPPQLSPYERGLVVGLFLGEAHFGGDGKNPQITLKMHTRHEPLLRWIHERFPRTKLYGPYTHSGRTFYQWMARGQSLVQDVLPVLDEQTIATLDPHSAQRLATMKSRYAEQIARWTPDPAHTTP